MLMLIYKVFLEPEWAELEQNGETAGAPIDLVDGYIHFSTAEQLRETVTKHFANKPNLILATVETDGIADEIKWEVSRGGAKFPHLYRKLKRSEVIAYTSVPRGEHGHILPKEIP
ncbi:DUF952 domain-containing protein [Falsihalocynthiibacter sp. SS001]|uniref:DUF952 domain-containing protein n=1 Tax=Falsihalocynthiibacter sp. SS001 TaxID=3349698 RepID=UPI0036D347E0